VRSLSQAALADSNLPLYPSIDLRQVHLLGPGTDAETLLSRLLRCDVLGFDTESKPTFLKGEASQGPHLIQLATDDEAFLFPIGQRGVPMALKVVLESGKVLKVGMGLGNDRSALKNKLDIELRHVIDLGEVLRGPTHRGTVGAKVAVAHFFGQRLIKSKKTGTSNWANPQLSEQQIRYAANDAHVALRIYRAWKDA
jgi:RNA polymerase sigma factor for flagellar operon FliA